MTCIETNIGCPDREWNIIKLRKISKLFLICLEITRASTKKERTVSRSVYGT